MAKLDTFSVDPAILLSLFASAHHSHITIAIIILVIVLLF